MKKSLVSLLGLMLAALMIFTGCAQTATPATTAAPADGAATTAAPAAEEFKFTRKIELVCPWGAGGGADTTLRTFAAALEKEVGVPVVVNNVEGGGGVQGSEYTFKQPADGYTFMIGTQSILLLNIQKILSFDYFEEFIPVTRLVHDTNIIVASTKAPYNNFDELVEYVKANPGKVKVGVLTITGVDAFMVRQTFELAGIEVPMIAFNNGAELNAAIIGGHIDLAVAGPAESKGLIDSGDMKGIIAASQERLSMIPDVQTTTENNIESLLGPMRGMFAKKGTPEEAIAAFEAASERAVASDLFQDWAKSNALDQRPGYANRADFQAIWNNEVVTLTELYDRYID